MPRSIRLTLPFSIRRSQTWSTFDDGSMTRPFLINSELNGFSYTITQAKTGFTRLTRLVPGLNGTVRQGVVVKRIEKT